MTCPNCHAAIERPAITLDELDGRDLDVARTHVKVAVTASLSMQCPSCGVQLAETVTQKVVEMVPLWPSEVVG